MATGSTGRQPSNSPSRRSACCGATTTMWCAQGQVLLIDESTGRAAPGRAWSQGLHQLVELKEGIAVSQENSTVTQITFQRFFPRYLRLAGTSGTLAEARRELKQVYRLEVLTLAPRLPRRVRRGPDRHFPDSGSLWQAVAARAAAVHEAGACGPDRNGFRRAIGSVVGRACVTWAGSPGLERAPGRQRKRPDRLCGPAGTDHSRNQHGGPGRGHPAGAGRAGTGRFARHSLSTQRIDTHRQAISGTSRPAGPAGQYRNPAGAGFSAAAALVSARLAAAASAFWLSEGVVVGDSAPCPSIRILYPEETTCNTVSCL